jgi:RHH-type transcriptional regulator, rel operon repressor / antitoxin RelB
MLQISARMPEYLVEELDAAARRLNRSRAEVLRQAAEAYLDDHEDLRIAHERLEDPSDLDLDWDEVRRELVNSDQEQRP